MDEAINCRAVKKLVRLRYVVHGLQHGIRFIINRTGVRDAMFIIGIVERCPSCFVLTIAVRWQEALQFRVEKAHGLLIRLHQTNHGCGSHVPYSIFWVHAMCGRGIPAGETNALQVVREIAVVVVCCDSLLAKFRMLCPSAYPFPEGVGQRPIRLPRSSLDFGHHDTPCRPSAAFAMLIHGEDVVPRAAKHQKRMIEVSPGRPVETGLV
mmetsp:Transcript_61206/g.114460  ORF Transcript_61206/g.114460 Transcript_61206/m.114460 type:complete len:209 (-) Transcript_61206:378-1004(-)